MEINHKGIYIFKKASPFSISKNILVQCDFFHISLLFKNKFLKDKYKILTHFHDLQSCMTLGDMDSAHAVH